MSSQAGGPPSRGEAPRGTLGTVHNAVLLLRLLAEGPSHQQLTDLAERSGLAVPTVHRLLRSLMVADLVEQDPASSRYGLGPELARLAHRYLMRLPVIKALSPYLVQVRNETGMTVLVSLLVRCDVVYVDRIDGRDAGEIYRDIHGVHHALQTAAGRLLVAHADDETWEQVLASAPEEVGEIGTDAREEWRDAPFVSTPADDLHPHAEVAVPVADGNGRVLAALSASGRPPEFEPEMLAAELRRAAKAAARTVGHG